VARAAGGRSPFTLPRPARLGRPVLRFERILLLSLVLLRPFPFDFGQKPRTHFHRGVAQVAGSFAQSLSVRREVCPAWASQEALSAYRLDCSPSRSTQRRKARAQTVRNPTALPDRRSSFLASPGSGALRLLVGPGGAFRVRTVCASLYSASLGSVCPAPLRFSGSRRACSSGKPPAGFGLRTANLTQQD